LSQWESINTAPKDGSHFLAWAELKMEEFDADALKMNDVVVRYAVVAYFVFGSFVEFPWRGSFPVNLKFTHWQALPDGPTQTQG
jgi:hypothetical protein